MNDTRPSLLRFTLLFVLMAALLVATIVLVPFEPLDPIHQLFTRVILSMLATASLAGAVWMAAVHFRH